MQAVSTVQAVVVWRLVETVAVTLALLVEVVSGTTYALVVPEGAAEMVGSVLVTGVEAMVQKGLL